MSKAVIVYIFEEPTEPLLMSNIITRTKEKFDDLPIISCFYAINNTAKEVINLFDKKEEQSNLVDHAKRELALLGNDEDFNESLIKAVEAFASYGHSGGSASVAIPMLNDLLQFKNLSPLTSNPKEWQKVEMGEEDCWQSRRNAEAFSNDGGKSYYLLSEKPQGGRNDVIIHLSNHFNKDE